MGASSCAGQYQNLRERGVAIVEPEDGILAGGDVGKGRLAGVESILSSVERCEQKKIFG